MSLFQQRHEILLLNNRGAEYLRCGEFDDAIKTLGDALTGVKQCARMEEADDGCSSCSGELDLGEWFRTVLELRTEQTSKQSIELQQQQQHNMMVNHQHHPSHHGYVYRHPIELPMDDDIAIMLRVQCVTIMFNLGMAFHLRGISYSQCYVGIDNRQVYEQSDENSIRVWALQNAIAMYELCYEMMGTEKINPGLHFIMSLTNNLGHSHALLHNFDKARICWQQLLSIQMFLVDSVPPEELAVTASSTSGASLQNGDGENNNNNTTGDSDSSSGRRLTPWEGFLDNTSSLILNDCCASAA